MQTKIYKNAYGDDVIVEEFGKREFAKLAEMCVNEAKWCDEEGLEYEDTIWIQYKDGSRFSYYDAFGFEGKFKKVNIVFGIINNPCTQQVCGEYTVNEDGIVEEVL